MRYILHAPYTPDENSRLRPRSYTAYARPESPLPICECTARKRREQPLSQDVDNMLSYGEADWRRRRRRRGLTTARPTNRTDRPTDASQRVLGPATTVRLPRDKTNCSLRRTTILAIRRRGPPTLRHDVIHLCRRSGHRTMSAALNHFRRRWRRRLCFTNTRPSLYVS